MQVDSEEGHDHGAEVLGRGLQLQVHEADGGEARGLHVLAAQSGYSDLCLVQGRWSTCGRTVSSGSRTTTRRDWQYGW